jgi:hypothetical protein
MDISDVFLIMKLSNWCLMATYKHINIILGTVLCTLCRKISEVANDSEIPTNYSFDQESLLSELSDSMQRSIKANSPYMVKTSSLSQASCTLQLTCPRHFIWLML